LSSAHFSFGLLPLGGARLAGRRLRPLAGFVFAIAMLWPMALVAVVEEVRSTPASARDLAKDLMVFDIAAQPLASALNRYGDLTGREALYDNALTQGRVSTPTQGVLTAETALARLLEGTGLTARFLPEGSFVLTPRPAEPLVQATPEKSEERYYGRIQASIRRALCANVGGRPGHYRVAALFWIGSAGRVVRYERLGTAGSADLDRAVDQSLRDLQIGAPPPSGFRQPVLAMVVPKAAEVTMGCDGPQDAERAAEIKP
jgi:hypothetical protein